MAELRLKARIITIAFEPLWRYAVAKREKKGLSMSGSFIGLQSDAVAQQSLLAVRYIEKAGFSIESRFPILGLWFQGHRNILYSLESMSTVQRARIARTLQESRNTICGTTIDAPLYQ